MNKRTCSVPDCERRHSARGMCNMHYQRWLKHGEVLAEKPPKFPEKTPPKCSVEECHQESSSRGWCLKHYQRWRSTGSVEDPAVSTKCVECDGRLDPTGNASDAVRKYCSTKCRRAAQYRSRIESGGYDVRAAAMKAKAKAIRDSLVKTCPQCSAAFTPKRSTAQKFCSRNCNVTFHRDSPDNQCSEQDCTRPVRARGVCNMHYKRILRAEGKYQAEPWDDRRRANYHKRRALKRELPADNIRPMDVYERDEWTCGLCNEAVPRDVKWPDPLSPSLDHILPLSKGGHHVMENVQLAHLGCNVQKGNRIEADEMLV